MGRRRGLKIPRGTALCEFESRLRHQRRQGLAPARAASALLPGWGRRESG
jgi:hypothetical protein